MYRFDPAQKTLQLIRWQAVAKNQKLKKEITTLE
jgi:hypothetical protein